MKKMILSLAFIAVTGILTAQNEEVIAIEKGDNLITIPTDKTDSANFTDFGKHLVKYGYTFDSKDPDFLLLVTAQKKPENGYWYSLNITFMDNKIVIRAKQSGLSLGSTITNPILIWADWYFAKSSGNYMRKSFDDFYPVLKDYGYQVIFSKE